MDNNYIVFDIGGTGIKWAIANEFGDILEDGKIALPKDINAFFDDLSELVSLHEKDNLQGIAISAPGAVDCETSIIGGSSAVPYIHGPNIREELKARTGLNVEIENDANCAALGECWLGAGKGYQDLAFVVSGTGIGGALVKNKRIHGGIHQHGGEFGYCILDFDPTKEGSERYKSWSYLGSTVAIVRHVAKAKGIDPNSIDGIQVFEMAKNGDLDAIEVINRFYDYMAIGIFNIQYHYDPEIIVLGGAISEREDFLPEIEKHMDEIFKHHTDAKIRPKIAVNQFGNKANLLGALYNYLSRNVTVTEE